MPLLPPAAPVLTPTGSWTIQAEPTACVLSRDFGTTVIGLRPVFDTDQVELFTIAPDRPAPSDVGTARVTLGAGTIETPYWITQRPGDKPIVRIVMPATHIASAVAGEWTVATGRIDRFRMTGVGKAMAALAECQRSLIAALGLQTEAATRPRLDGMVAQFFGESSFPQAARDRREQGLVTTRLLVDQRGRATDCRTTGAASAILAQQTCAIAVHHIRFRSARDAADRPVVSTYGLTVRWALPQ